MTLHFDQKDTNVDVSYSQILFLTTDTENSNGIHTASNLNVLTDSTVT